VLGSLYGKSKWEEYAADRYAAAAERQKDIEARISVCREPIGFITSLLCAYEASDASQGDYTAQNDLKAQQDMSIWAFGMFVTSFATLLVTAFGVFFVWLTLKKADETNRAAITASEAGIMANEIMRQEQRPWLKFTVERREGSTPLDPSFIFWIENRGESPARDVLLNVFDGEINSGRKESLVQNGVSISVIFPHDREWGHCYRAKVREVEIWTITALAKYALPNGDIATTQAPFIARRVGKIIEIEEAPGGQVT